MVPALDAMVDATRSVVVVTHDAVVCPTISSIDPTSPL
ncbi:hypothetical protein KXS11_10460 [Plantibacter flavus]